MNFLNDLTRARNPQSRWPLNEQETTDRPGSFLLSLIESQNAMQPRGGGGGYGAQAPGGGGLLELLYGPDVPGHADHLHLAKAKGIVPLGRQLEQMGFAVGEHPRFGGVAPVHTENSHHYNRDAIDVNYRGGGQWDSEAQALQWLENWLGQNYG